MNIPAWTQPTFKLLDVAFSRRVQLFYEVDSGWLKKRKEKLLLSIEHHIKGNNPNGAGKFSVSEELRCQNIKPGASHKNLPWDGKHNIDFGVFIDSIACH